MSGLTRDESMPIGIFQPDTLLPSQFFDLMRRKIPSGEKLLLLAVLQDACELFLGTKKRWSLQKDIKEANDWILDNKSDLLFSFNGVCEALGFDPQYIREGLLRRQIQILKNGERIKLVQRKVIRPSKRYERVA